MGNKIPTPFLNYESASSHFSSPELDQAVKNFRSICINDQPMDKSLFVQSFSCSSYMTKYVLPRLFFAIDTNKSNTIDLEKYICALSLFRFGSVEDQLKLLFLMYLPPKGGGMLTRDALKALLKDANALRCQKDAALYSLEAWLEELNDLNDGIVDTVILQYGTSDGKVPLAEFCAFAKTEDTLLLMVEAIATVLDNKR